jgi:hypothetical protein
LHPFPPTPQKDPLHHWHLHFFGGQNVWLKKNPLNVAAEVQHPDSVSTNSPGGTPIDYL